MFKVNDIVVITNKNLLEGKEGVITHINSRYINVMLDGDIIPTFFEHGEVKLIPKLGLLYRLLDFYM